MTECGTPDPLLLEMMAERPVAAVLAPGDRRVWLVGGHDLVREVLSEPARFTSMFDEGLASMRDDMVLLDPPEHTRMRRLAGRPFSGRRLRRLEPQITAMVDDLVGAMATAGPPLDLVRHFAIPLPAGVMGLALGVPPQDRMAMYRWIDPFTAAAPATAADRPSDADVAPVLDDMYTYVTRLVDARLEQPADDLLSDLVTARAGDGDALTRDELIATAALMIIAGQETTAKAITRGVLLLSRTDHWRRLASGDLATDAVVEELLRHQSPIDTSIFRRAVVDTELAGVPIKAGEQVFVSLHLANFDPAARKDPARFDPCRTDQGHVAFGHGAHLCLGAGLARAELTAAFTALATRFPDLRVTVPRHELTWSTGSVVNAPTTLPVTW